MFGSVISDINVCLYIYDTYIRLVRRSLHVKTIIIVSEILLSVQAVKVLHTSSEISLCREFVLRMQLVYLLKVSRFLSLIVSQSFLSSCFLNICLGLVVKSACMLVSDFTCC